jgi:hypothetical protein
MEKNTAKNDVFEVRSKIADRLTVKEAKILFKELEAPDCPYNTLSIRTVMSPEISDLLYKAMSKNKSITAINGEHMFGHESIHLKALKKNPDLPLKSLVLSCPEPPKKLASYFQQKRQLTRLSLTFSACTPDATQTTTNLDETIEAIATNITTLELFSIRANENIGPGGLEGLLRNNQGLRSVSINIHAFNCHHRMIVKRLGSFGAILAKLPALTSLKFLVDSFDTVEVEAFLESLKQSKTIKELWLNQYWIGLGSIPLIEDILSIQTLETLRLKGYTELHRYKDNVNENNRIDVSPLFDNKSQLREIECAFIPYRMEKLFAALETNTNLRRIYIHPLESRRVLSRLYEELDDNLQIDICHAVTDNLPYELLLEHHNRRTRRRDFMSIKLNLLVISSARDRGLFSLLPQEVLEVIWFKLLRMVMDIDVKQTLVIFDRLGDPYRK